MESRLKIETSSTRGHLRKSVIRMGASQLCSRLSWAKAIPNSRPESSKTPVNTTNIFLTKSPKKRRRSMGQTQVRFSTLSLKNGFSALSVSVLSTRPRRTISSHSSPLSIRSVRRALKWISNLVLTFSSVTVKLTMYTVPNARKTLNSPKLTASKNSPKLSW